MNTEEVAYAHMWSYGKRWPFSCVAVGRKATIFFSRGRRKLARGFGLSDVEFASNRALFCRCIVKVESR